MVFRLKDFSKYYASNGIDDDSSDSSSGSNDRQTKDIIIVDNPSHFTHNYTLAVSVDSQLCKTVKDTHVS